jgi:hypothetical protein
MLASLLHAGPGDSGRAKGKPEERRVNILYPLTFGRGSEALDFVRTLRELSDVRLGEEVVGIGPVLVYGARIVAPDAPAELYASLGALTLVHLLGMDAAAARTAHFSFAPQLPADMALLFTATAVPDESVARGA